MKRPKIDVKKKKKIWNKNYSTDNKQACINEQTN